MKYFPELDFEVPAYDPKQYTSLRAAARSTSQALVSLRLRVGDMSGQEWRSMDSITRRAVSGKITVLASKRMELFNKLERLAGKRLDIVKVFGSHA